MTVRIPTATYRIQFGPDFGFRAAEDILPYLKALGVSDLYASPIFKALKGSTHGYDVVDPNRLNPELGSEAEFTSLIRAAKSYDMGWLQDIVPNHMAWSHENSMLMDVLENEARSRYRYFFDVEWDHPAESMKGRLLAPFLGEFFADCLEKGEIQLIYDADGLWAAYYDMRFAIKIDSYPTVFTYNLDRIEGKIGRDHPDFEKFLGIARVLENPGREESTQGFDQIVPAKRLIRELYEGSKEIGALIDENISVFNGRPGDPLSFHLLDQLLSEQIFRLAFWKVATQELNYRRFFNVNELICLRVEEDDVFRTTHELVFDLLEKGAITGLRIDHIDGLYDPLDYLRSLRKAAPDAYIVVEKILDMEEELPPEWPVQGNTGYDFLNRVNGLFCRKKNQGAFDRIYFDVSGTHTDVEELACEKKKLILTNHMAGDMDNLAHLLKRVSSKDRRAGDITLHGLRAALFEVMSRFPVYRTYVSKDLREERDRLRIMSALEKARKTQPGLASELDFLQKFLSAPFDGRVTDEEEDPRIRFAMRFQQYTGPLMAKGFEDTLLYVYNRLISLNEVGGDPARFGIRVEEFHRSNEAGMKSRPHTLSATATHDTKRGEDVRARINVLSEIPREWSRQWNLWRTLNRGKKRRIDGKEAPDANDEYFLYQTLVGAFPLHEGEYTGFLERMKACIIKAVREAKVHTAWLKPDSVYEDACLAFVEEILEPSRENRFLKAFFPFQRRISWYGMFYSLSQALLKMTAPGVPDFYQGTELWDLTLVDPDNRRPVDYEKRSRFLQEIADREKEDASGLIGELLSSMEDGRVKLFLIYKGLKARNRYKDVFDRGEYVPLEIRGIHKEHVVVFARKYNGMWAVIVCPRFLVDIIAEGEQPLGGDLWGDTCIPLPEGSPSQWEESVTGGTVTLEGSILVGDALARFPGCLLIGKGTS